MPSAKQMQLATFSTADTLIMGYSTHETPTDKIRAPQDGEIVHGKGIKNSDAQNNAHDSTPQQFSRCAAREIAMLHDKESGVQVARLVTLAAPMSHRRSAHVAARNRGEPSSSSYISFGLLKTTPAKYMYGGEMNLPAAPKRREGASTSCITRRYIAH
jgi:hypothetical protein